MDERPLIAPVAFSRKIGASTTDFLSCFAFFESFVMFERNLHNSTLKTLRNADDADETENVLRGSLQSPVDCVGITPPDSR